MQNSDNLGFLLQTDANKIQRSTLNTAEQNKVAVVFQNVDTLPLALANLAHFV